MPLETLVAEHNANARYVPRLWARAKIAVTLQAEGTTFTWGSVSPMAQPNGLLLLAKGTDPFGRQDFVLIGRETAALEIFRAGSSTDQRLDYFWYRLGDRGAWFARREGEAAPGLAALPIDPGQLVSLLGVTPLPPPGRELPAVALSMQNTPGDCAYAVMYLDRGGADGRVLLRRQVFYRWSGQAPRQAYKVNLLDARGRSILTASLGGYRPIRVADVEEMPAAPPVMPTDIKIVTNPWPGMATFVKSIHLVLSEMTTEDKWDRSACDFAPPSGVKPAWQPQGPPAQGPPASAPAGGGPPR